MSAQLKVSDGPRDLYVKVMRIPFDSRAVWQDPRGHWVIELECTEDDLEDYRLPHESDDLLVIRFCMLELNKNPAVKRLMVA